MGTYARWGAALLGAALAWSAHARTELLVSQWLPASHPIAGAMEEWNKRVEAATDGRVVLKTLPQPVTSPPGHYNAVRDGLADVAVTVVGYTPGRFPLAEIAELPLMADTARANSIAFQRAAERMPQLVTEFKDVKVLAFFTHGPGVIFNTRKPIRTLEDLRGLKFRVGGGMVTEVSKQLNANTALKPAPDSYELISTGVMDGSWLPFEGVTTYNLDKLVRYATVFPGGLYNTAFIVMMNKSRWSALSAKDQAIVAGLSGLDYARRLGEAFDQRDARAREAAVAAGMQIEPVTPELLAEVKRRMAPIEDRWAEVARRKGVADPRAVIRQYRLDAAEQ